MFITQKFNKEALRNHTRYHNLNQGDSDWTMVTEANARCPPISVEPTEPSVAYLYRALTDATLIQSCLNHPCICLKTVVQN